MKLGAIVQTSAFAIRTAICAVRGDSKLKKRSTNLRFGKIKTWLAAIAIAALSTGSYAFTVVKGEAPTTINFSWSYSTGFSLLTGNGSMMFTWIGPNGRELDVGVYLKNTSQFPSERLTAFGFSIDNDATDLAAFSDVDDGGIVGAIANWGDTYNIGNGIYVEVCAWGGSNCSSSTGGIFGDDGQDSFAITLYRLVDPPWGDSVEIDPLAFRYNTDYGSFKFTSDMSGPPPPDVDPPGSVPEPGTGALALLSLGLLGAGFGLRRRSSPA